MKTRYCIEITGDPSPDYHFAYFDTDEYLAFFLFKYERIDVTIDAEYGAEDDPYRMVECRVPKEQRKAFLHAMDLLPAFMAYAGKADYTDYCREFFLNAGQFLTRRREAGRITPLQ